MKKSFGVTEVGWTVVISNIIFFLISNVFYAATAKIHNTSALFYLCIFFCPIYALIQAGIAFAIITPFINICLGIGIIYQKKIFIILFITHQIFNMLLASFYGFFAFVLTKGLFKSGLAKEKGIDLMDVIAVSLLFSINIVFIRILTRPKVKEHFSTKCRKCGHDNFG